MEPMDPELMRPMEPLHGADEAEEADGADEADEADGADEAADGWSR